MTRDKKLWVFNAGPAFNGNPRWLYEYIQRKRPDITCYWFCYRRRLMYRLRAMGCRAMLFDSHAARKIGSRAGVYVVNQNKEVIQDYLQGVTILNLWHGVGCKAIENCLHSGILDEGIAKKHIRNNLYYKRDMLFLVTSPLMERHFKAQCSIDEDKLIRAGYPCVAYPHPEEARTFDHRIVQTGPGQHLALYAPTYRDYVGDSLDEALPDFDKLVQVLREKSLRLIIKVHPNMTKSRTFLHMKRRYQACSELLFWDNDNDIYEVLDRIELAIVDYSSMFYDLMARGVRHFIRYTYDFEHERQTREFALDYHEHTCGSECKTFDELLWAMRTYDQRDDTAEIERLISLFWEYDSGDTFDVIVERALQFEPDPSYVLPTLYSFDIFDTLIARSTHVPEGIFYHVKERIAASSLGYPAYFARNYVDIRMWCESDARNYHDRSPHLSERGRTEISFDEIFTRMAATYGLSAAQAEQLKAWELEAEKACSVPIPSRIERVKALVEQGEDVVLISDMYLPQEFVKELLEQADPALAALPLFLSSDRGGQKTKKALFLDVYHTLDYGYGSWIHCGDSYKADYDVPRSLGITPDPCDGAMPFADFERGLVGHAQSFDAYRLAHMLAAYRMSDASHDYMGKKYFTYAICSLYFVPYVLWAVRDACARHVQTLYFISRDGYLLKLVADEAIRVLGLPIRTKYLYGSRKAWRLPSQIDAIDDDFFTRFGNFAATRNYERIVESSFVNETEFLRLFPSLSSLKGMDRDLSKTELDEVRLVLSRSDEYRRMLLQKAAEERPLVDAYLRQEIDFSERYAFVEYWGRGYTQSCLRRLINHAAGERKRCEFYYARSIYLTVGDDVRLNYSANTQELLFVESLFANHPYESVTGYAYGANGHIEPVMNARVCDFELFEDLNECLVQFTRDYLGLPKGDEDALGRTLFDWALRHYSANEDKEPYISHLAHLTDAVELNGESSVFAPQFTMGSFMVRAREGRWPDTKSTRMSVAQSNVVVQKLYSVLKGIYDEEGAQADAHGKLYKLVAGRLKR